MLGISLLRVVIERWEIDEDAVLDGEWLDTSAAGFGLWGPGNEDGWGQLASTSVRVDCRVL